MLCGTVTGLVTSVALTVLLPNELRGLCIGAFIAIAGLIGFGVAPSLVAWRQHACSAAKAASGVGAGDRRDRPSASSPSSPS